MRLHVIGLLLGQVDSIVSADTLKPTTTDDKLKTEILEMADLVVSAPLGQRQQQQHQQQWQQQKSRKVALVALVTFVHD